MSSDNVNHPSHYTQHTSRIECIEVAEHLGFNLGNAFKYIFRAGRKGNELEDIQKALWYITREREGKHRTLPKTGLKRVENLISNIGYAEQNMEKNVLFQNFYMTVFSCRTVADYKFTLSILSSAVENYIDYLNTPAKEENNADSN